MQCLWKYKMLSQKTAGPNLGLIQYIFYTISKYDTIKYFWNSGKFYDKLYVSCAPIEQSFPPLLKISKLPI